MDALKSLTDFQIGGIKFPETKIGETVTKADDWLSGKVHDLEAKPPQGEAPPEPPKNQVLKVTYEDWRRDKERAKQSVPPKIPLPPPLRPRLRFRKGPK